MTDRMISTYMACRWITSFVLRHTRPRLCTSSILPRKRNMDSSSSGGKFRRFAIVGKQLWVITLTEQDAEDEGSRVPG
jgi:hypothetical protein